MNWAELGCGEVSGLVGGREEGRLGNWQHW